MSNAITVLRGEAYTQRFSSLLDDEPFDQTGRTVTATFYFRGNGESEQVLEIITDVDGTGDDRLVALDQEDDPGVWELRLGASDTAAFEPGPYRWHCRSASNSDAEDIEFLIPPANCSVVETGVE